MSSSSDESSSSGTPPPVNKGKGKGKESSSQKHDTSYVPSKGFKVVTNVNDSEEWDWDTLDENEDLELWLIRVPDNVKPKHLEKISIESSRSSKSTKVGTINRKNSNYDIWNVGDDASDQLVGGEEMKHVSCLLPRRTKKGELRLASRSIARHLIVSAQAVTPSTAGEEAPIQLKNPPRHSYPKGLLTHRFTPYGAVVSRTTEKDAGDADAMDVDESAKQTEATGAKVKRKKVSEQEQSSPSKKSKKPKVAK